MEFYATNHKTITIHMRGVVDDGETFAPISANDLTINGQFATFIDGEGRFWKTELSEVSSIIFTDKNEKQEVTEQQPIVAEQLAPLNVPKEDFEVISALRKYGLETFELGRFKHSEWVDAAVESFSLVDED